MGQAGPANEPEIRAVSGSELPEETKYLVHDALRCFSLVQVLNGAIASLVTLAGYMYKQASVTGTQWRHHRILRLQRLVCDIVTTRQLVYCDLWLQLW